VNRWQQASGGAIVFALLGIATGAVFGAFHRTERWQTVRDARFGLGLFAPGPFCRSLAQCGPGIAAHVTAF
jgi:hypothetical protein